MASKYNELRKPLFDSKGNFANNQSSNGSPPIAKTVTVSKGDNMWSIAQKHNLSLDTLVAANKHIKNPSLIIPGQIINIPETPPLKNNSITVKKGDNLWNLAKANNIPLKKLEEANTDIKNPRLIYPGQQINMPTLNKLSVKNNQSQNKLEDIRKKLPKDIQPKEITSIGEGLLDSKGNFANKNMVNSLKQNRPQPKGLLNNDGTLNKGTGWTAKDFKNSPQPNSSLIPAKNTLPSNAKAIISKKELPKNGGIFDNKGNLVNASVGKQPSKGILQPLLKNDKGTQLKPTITKKEIKAEDNKKILQDSQQKLQPKQLDSKVMRLGVNGRPIPQLGGKESLANKSLNLLKGAGNFIKRIDANVGHDSSMGDGPKNLPNTSNGITNGIADFIGQGVNMAVSGQGIGKASVQAFDKGAETLGSKMLSKIIPSKLSPKAAEEATKALKIYNNIIKNSAHGANFIGASEVGQQLAGTKKFSPADIAKGYGEGALVGGAFGAGGELLKLGLPRLKPNLKTTPIINPILKPGEKSVATAETKNAGFKNNIIKSNTTSSELKSALNNKDISYTPITNKDTLQNAHEYVKANYDNAINMIKSNQPATAEHNAVAQVLIQKAQHEGRFNDAIDLIEHVAKKATSQGQAIQALSMWGRLTPEGMLKYANKVVQAANKERPGLNLKINEDTAKTITESMNNIANMPEGRERDVAVAKVLDTVASQVPPTTLQKISSLQTMAQLLNPKTAIRNVIGNAGFAGAENVSNVVGTGLDKLVSLGTKQRTTLLPSLPTQLKGFKQGWKLGLEDALNGINTSGLGSQFDIPTHGTFKKGFLGGAEKAMNVELKATDRAFYQSAYDQSLRNQMKISNVTPPTEAMQEIAHHDALYRTFQDNNAISTGLSKLKNALNGGKEFGLGDLVIKYPRTPGSILSRGIDYSPVGFVKSVFEMSKPLMGKPFNQKAFVDATSRALAGTGGVVGTGAILHKLGIITGKTDMDPDAKELLRNVGLGDYKVNVSALKRFVSSGLDPQTAKLQKGDTIINYDWFQPLSIGLAVGADIDANKGSGAGVVGSIANALQSGMDTVAEQPLLQGIKNFTMNSNKSVTKGFGEVAKGVPASFIPTLLNQIRQLTDNTSRNTSNPNILKEAMNLTQAKIPGLSKRLLPRIDNLGQTKQVYQNGSNNLANVFLNPAFVSKYNPSPAQSIQLDILNKSGETKQIPSLLKPKITYKGNSINLTPEQLNSLQQYVGQMTKEAFDKFAKSDQFKNLSPEVQTKLMEKVADKYKLIGKLKMLKQISKKNDN